ncbi:MAG: hypothetical protein KJ666_18035 [Bacteroidetes bacterium]|nr:hypothetical protein [Bacteroidota bacterium]
MPYNVVAFKRTPRSVRYKHYDLLFIKFTYTKTEQTKSTFSANITTDYSVPLETLVRKSIRLCQILVLKKLSFYF